VVRASHAQGNFDTVRRRDPLALDGVDVATRPFALSPAAALSAFTARPNGYCFFSGVIGVTGCAPPVDFGPGVTPALFSLASLDSAAVMSVFGFAPFVGPLPASSVDTAPFVGPLPASAFGCANAGAERPTAIAEMSKLPRNKNMRWLL
jgi:hypothetical protein